MGSSKKLDEKDKLLLDFIKRSKDPLNDIRSRLKVSRQTINRRIRKLKDLGLIIGNGHKGFTIMGDKHHLSKKRFTNKAPFRLHDLQFSITTKHVNKKFQPLRLSNHTILIYKNKIEVYQKPEASIIEYDIKILKRKFIQYYDVFFQRLEDRLGTNFYKDGWRNIAISRGEIEEWNSEYGKWMNKEDLTKMKICSSDDGKIWMKYDQSRSGNNVEFCHPETFFEDTERYDKIITSYGEQPDQNRIWNSYRDGKAFYPDETTEKLKKIVDIQLREAQKWEVYAEHWKSHAELIIDLRKELNELREERKKSNYKEDYKNKFGHEFW